MSQFHVYVTRRIPEAGIKVLEAAHDVSYVEISPYDRVLTKSELLSGVREADGVLCLLTDQIDEEVLFVVAEKSGGSIRELEGFFNNVVGQASMLNVPINKTLVNDVSSRLLSTKSIDLINITLIPLSYSIFKNNVKNSNQSTYY